VTTSLFFLKMNLNVILQMKFEQIPGNFYPAEVNSTY